jgi:hypothetical protein
MGVGLLYRFFFLMKYFTISLVILYTMIIPQMTNTEESDNGANLKIAAKEGLYINKKGSTADITIPVRSGIESAGDLNTKREDLIESKE